jgi:hypothetical protein
MTFPALLVLAPALRPDPDPAREWVRSELAKREYQPTLMDRISRWLYDLLQRILDAAGGLGALDSRIALVLLIALVVVLAVVLARLRPDPSRRRRVQPGAVLPDVRVSAAEHRALAERAVADGRWDDAVVEAMRAIAVGLVERDLIDDEPGATAREVTDRATRLFADLGTRLRAASETFDGVRYGDHHADRATAAGLLDLEATLRAARASEQPLAGPVAAVPR